MAIVPFTAVANSTIWDVCLNTYGSLDEIVKLMVDNLFPNVNTYPKNGQVFFFDDSLVENQNNLQTILAPGKFATQGGVAGTISPTNPTMGILYSEVFETEYVSNANGVVTVNLATDIPAGAIIVEIIKEIRPIEDANWSFNSTSRILTLLNGVSVDNGQTLFILYKVLQTS